VVGAKAYLLEQTPAQRLEIEPMSIACGKLVAPGAPQVLQLRLEDVQDKAVRVAAFISARLAIGVAAWELVRAGVAFQAGPHAARSLDFNWTTVTPGSGGQSGGSEWRDRFVMLYPEAIWRPVWHDTPSQLLDADLYLRHFTDGDVHLGEHVQSALRISLECFRQELYVPCVAMLGAASEAVWIETGLALSARYATEEPRADKLRALLENARTSTFAKIKAVCDFYDQPLCDPVRTAAAVDNTRLHDIRRWSDEVRESRNVLHWGSAPMFPNTYEKVAILLLGAVSRLRDLAAVRRATRVSIIRLPLRRRDSSA
jgi:hypothetical protein